MSIKRDAVQWFRSLQHCANCGFDADYRCIEVDHIVMQSKWYAPFEKSRKLWKRELEKCQWLCKNCHTIKTVIDKHNQKKTTLPTPKLWWSSLKETRNYTCEKCGFNGRETPTALTAYCTVAELRPYKREREVPQEIQKQFLSHCQLLCQNCFFRCTRYSSPCPRPSVDPSNPYLAFLPSPGQHTKAVMPTPIVRAIEPYAPKKRGPKPRPKPPKREPIVIDMDSDPDIFPSEQA